VTRSKLIDLLTQRFPQYSRQDVDVSVKEIINGLSDAMKERRRIEIRWFGSFYFKYRKERTGRNPRTGESVQIPGKNVLNFKASKELRLRVKEV
jgi:integration host factor subunit beta